MFLSQSYEMSPPSGLTSTRMLSSVLFVLIRYNLCTVLLNLFRNLFSLCVFELIKSCYQVFVLIYVMLEALEQFLLYQLCFRFSRKAEEITNLRILSSLLYIISLKNLQFFYVICQEEITVSKLQLKTTKVLRILLKAERL